MVLSMPSEGGPNSPQARLMRADYGRAKRGQKTRTGMDLEKLREWVRADSAVRKSLKRKEESE